MLSSDLIVACYLIPEPTFDPNSIELFRSIVVDFLLRVGLPSQEPSIFGLLTALSMRFGCAKQLISYHFVTSYPPYLSKSLSTTFFDLFVVVGF